MAIVHSAALACRVAAAVEPVADLLAGGGIHRAGTAQGGEAGVAADPAGVAAGGGQQRGGDLPGHALLGQELFRGGVDDEFPERGIQPGGLGRQLLVAAGRAGHRRPGALGRAGQVLQAEPGRHLHLPLGRQPG